MNYEFISNEKAMSDWKNGLVQDRHNRAGKSEKLTRLTAIAKNNYCTPTGTHCFYKITENGYWVGAEYSETIPSVPTDELHDMVFGEGKYKPEEAHKCKYCGAMVTGNDDRCYKNPNMNLHISDLSPQPEEREIIGYELNGIKTAEQMADFVGGFPSLFTGLITDKKTIKALSLYNLGILSTCFNPVYKEKEVKVELSDGEEAWVNKRYCEFLSQGYNVSITDIQRITDAYKTL